MNPWATGSEREAYFAAIERAAHMQQLIGMQRRALDRIHHITGINDAMQVLSDGLNFDRIGDEGCTAIFGEWRAIAERELEAKA